MFKRILIVVDTRPVARAAIKEGLALAEAHGAGVLLFSVLPRYSVPLSDAPPFAAVSPKQFLKEVKAEAEAILAEASLAAEKLGVMARSATGTGDDDARCIVAAAQMGRCDLIVVASEGHNALVRLLTGSVIPGLITASQVPVLVCKPRQRRAAQAQADALPPTRQRSAGRPAAASSTH